MFADVRAGLRQIARRPTWALAIIVVLALGIGANTAMFSGFEAWVVRPLDFPEPERLVLLQEAQPKIGRERIAVSARNFGDWRERQRSFSAMGALQRHRYNLADTGEPIRLDGARVSSTLFALLGKRPILGRSFTQEEDRPGRASAVALISERLWRERFDGENGVVGRTIRLDGRVHEIVGVMEPGFRFPEWAEIWTPLGLDTSSGDRADRGLSVYARLAPGVSVASAQAELAAIATKLEAEYPQANRDFTARVLELHDAFVPSVIQVALTASLASSLFVLLVICANVASLMLAQASARSRETALRAALGASRWRLVRKSLVEGILLAIPAGALGACLGVLGVRSMLAYVPVEPPYLFSMSFRSSAGIYTFAVALVAGLLCGAAPVARTAGGRVYEALKSGGRASGPSSAAKRARGVLVAAEIALSTALVAAAALMVESFLALQAVDPGFDSRGVLTAELSLEGEGFEPAGRAALAEHIVEALSGISGVEIASAVSTLPASQSNEVWELTAEGRDSDPGEAVLATAHSVEGRYFETLGVRLLAGRAFTDAEAREGGKVVVVSAGLARRLFGVDDVVGRRIGGARASEPTWYRIVGVVGDVDIGRDMVDADLPTVQIYQPYGEAPTSSLAAVVRAKGNVAHLSSSMRDAIRRSAPGVPVSEVLTMADAVFRVRWVSRFFARQLVTYSALAMLIAMVGLYALTVDSVTERTRELAIRHALGAARAHLIGLVLKDAAILGSVGVLVGLVLAFAFGRLASQMFVTVSSPLLLATVGGVLFGVTILAAFLPAKRVSRLDPVSALRSE
jgi:putative ABC transport system permease protein